MNKGMDWYVVAFLLAFASFWGAIAIGALYALIAGIKYYCRRN